LQQAPDRELVTAAATLAKGLVLAGSIGKELRGRR
jgi:hypothetical protein